MKYESEINKMLEESLREPWMNDEDWNEVKTLMATSPDFNFEKMEKDIEIGIKNGYSLEYQLTLCKKIFLRMKANGLR